MQPGDLVRITRASIGVPKDTIALIVSARRVASAATVEGYQDEAYDLFHVQLITDTKLNGRVRRYLSQDLRKLKQD